MRYRHQDCLRNLRQKSSRRRGGLHIGRKSPGMPNRVSTCFPLVVPTPMLSLLAAKEKNRPSTYTIIEPAIAMSKISYSTPGALTRARADSFDKENHLRRSTAIEYREHEHAPGSYHAVDDPAVYVTAYNGHSVSSSMSGFTEPSSSTSTLSDPNGHCAMPVWSALQMGPESDSSWSMMSRGDSAQMIMDNSLEAVIETLKVTANHPLECAKWVVVAAHYRSQGNTPAAIAVMSGMIEGPYSVLQMAPRMRWRPHKRLPGHYSDARRGYGPRAAETSGPYALQLSLRCCAPTAHFERGHRGESISSQQSMRWFSPSLW